MALRTFRHRVSVRYPVLGKAEESVTDKIIYSAHVHLFSLSYSCVCIVRLITDSSRSVDQCVCVCVLSGWGMTMYYGIIQA